MKPLPGCSLQGAVVGDRGIEDAGGLLDEQTGAEDIGGAVVERVFHNQTVLHVTALQKHTGTAHTIIGIGFRQITLR